MNRILLLTLILLSQIVYSQDSTSTACYYTSAEQFLRNEPNRIGHVITESNTEFSFYYLYHKMTQNSRNTWGYINSNGIFYRSIDYIFYKVVTYSKIVVYEAVIDGEKKNKISLGLRMYPVDLSEANVKVLIAENISLLQKYELLSKKDRTNKAIEFINAFNENNLASIDKNKSVDNQ